MNRPATLSLLDRYGVIPNKLTNRPTPPAHENPELSYVSLTQGQLSLVDTGDYSYLNQWSWGALWSQNIGSFYAARAFGHNGRTVVVGMHQQLTTCPDGFVVDHINGNTLDNRCANLRVVTKSQSCVNRRKFKNNTSGHRGVVWDRTNNLWVARIGSGGVRRTLGYFTNISDAAGAYELAALQLHGEFRRVR